eukprot:g13979.t1
MIEFVKDLLGFMADAAGHAEMQVGFVMAMGEVAQAALHTGSGVAMAMSEVGQAALHTGTSVLIGTGLPTARGGVVVLNYLD